MTAQTEAAASTLPDVPVHTRTADRFGIVKLDWPVEFGGRVFNQIIVNRMSVKQLAAYMETIATDSGLAALPMFDVPRAVIEALDADDGAKLDEEATRFLPRVFGATSASPPSTGENTSPLPPSALADSPSSG